MIRRQLYKKLLDWKAKEFRKPLILRGARQVGKTTLVNQFSKEFDQYIYLNLEKTEDKNIFLNAESFEELIDAIFFIKNKDKTQAKTLIFIDEIQNVPTAINHLRYFYEQLPQYYVVAAGSLLETILDDKVKIPVGRTEVLFLRPISFVEFVLAIEGEQMASVLGTIPIPQYAHSKFTKMFHLYMLIGGMPEVVDSYIKNKELSKLKPIYENLITSYIDDVEKYAKDNKLIQVIRHVILSTLRLAGNRIKFQNFGASSYTSKQVKEAFLILEKALIIKLVRPTTSLKLPVLPDFNKSPKIQFFDTGLINAYAGLQLDLFQTKDIDSFHDGLIAEHIVGQELITTVDSLLFNLNFWIREKKQSNAEVDYVYPFRNLLIPIEVKAGSTGRLRSLHQFIDRVDHHIGVRIYSGKYIIEETKTIAGKKYKLLNLPFYLISKLDDYLSLLVS